MEFTGNCKEFGRQGAQGAGLFCANYYHAREGWPRCLGIWCANCYVRDKSDLFPIRKPINGEGHVLDLQSEKDRFKLARVRDHLMTHFRCDLCHFPNVQGWGPDSTYSNDDMILMWIPRANLDALWSRESKTVYHNWREGVKFVTKARKLGLNCARNLPALGPFLVRDKVSMFTAITLE